MAREKTPDDISPNKLNEKQERRAEQIKERLMHQGLGRDEAEKRAQREAVQERSAGGHNVGGEPTRGAGHG